MIKFCPPPMIILMDFLFIFLFILLYTSKNETTISFSLPDTFPSDLIPVGEQENMGIKIICPATFNECKNIDYLLIPNELRIELANVVLNSLLPPRNCKSIKIPLTKIENGKTWLNKKILIEQNKCLRE